MANVKFSAITASGGNPASTDRLVGVTSGNADVLFTRAQLDASIAPAATNVTGLAAVATSGSASDLSAGTVAAARLSTATTQAAGDNTTKIATDAFVTTAVANAIAGVNPAVAVQAATTAAVDTSGFTYNNGVAGIGATFTGSVNTAVTIDGFTFTALGQRLLVKNDMQAPSGAFNGVYNVTQLQTGILPPILTRALDYDAPSDINNTGAIPVVNGTVNANTSWLLTSTVNTVGTDPLTYVQFSASPTRIQPVTLGGTGLATLTAHAVMLGEGTGSVGFATIGTGGRLLIDQGAAADPAFTAMSGDVTITSGGVTTFSKTGFLKTYVSSSDPGVGNDNTQGYAAGSYGVNTGTGRAFGCRDASTGVAVWEPIGPSVHPGFIANNWYGAHLPGVTFAASAAPVAGTTYLVPFFIPFRMTIHALGWRITTLGTSNTQAALYKNNSGASAAVNRPGTLLASTGSIVNTGTGVFSNTLSADQQVEPGWYWAAMQNNDTTVRYAACAIGQAMGTVTEILGSSTLATALPSTANSLMGLSFTGTFGTWPADISASSFSEVIAANTIPEIVFQPITIP